MFRFQNKTKCPVHSIALHNVLKGVRKFFLQMKFFYKFILWHVLWWRSSTFYLVKVWFLLYLHALKLGKLSRFTFRSLFYLVKRGFFAWCIFGRRNTPQNRHISYENMLKNVQIYKFSCVGNGWKKFWKLYKSEISI